MKRLYKIIIMMLYKFILKIDLIKVLIVEKIALNRKKKMYKDISWTKIKKKDFDNYWKYNYGRKVSSKGNKLYESINGTYNFSYIPDFFFATKVEPFFNSKYLSEVYSDKSLTEIFYANNYGIKFPKTIVLNSNNVFLNSLREIISKEEALRILWDIGEVVIKPTQSSDSGIGVNILKVKGGIDVYTNQDVLSIINKYSSNFIFQEKMNQHEKLSSLHPHSINTIRIITYILDGICYSTKLCLRIGMDGNHVDNIHSGGLVVGIDKDGYLKDTAYRLWYTNSKEKFKKHPNSNIIFKGYKIPSIELITTKAKLLHAKTPNIGLISWDFMIDTEGVPVIIEANYHGQSAWFPQIVHGDSLFGANSELILRKLNKRGEKYEKTII